LVVASPSTVRVRSPVPAFRIIMILDVARVVIVRMVAVVAVRIVCILAGLSGKCAQRQRKNADC